MAHGKMRAARKVKRQLTESKKTGDQQNATASDKVRSTVSRVRVTRYLNRRGGLERENGSDDDVSFVLLVLFPSLLHGDWYLAAGSCVLDPVNLRDVVNGFS
jgi:hypothetical protein